MTTRRDLLKVSLATAAGLAVPGQARRAFAMSGSREAGLTPNTFNRLPLGSIRPAGWLLRQLRTQADGLSGHLDEFWPDVGSNSGWLGGSGESWERGPYFLDGLVPLAWSLDDDVLKKKAQRYIDWTLTHQGASGMIGPATNNDWWPRMVMVKVLAHYYEVSGDPRVLPVLTRYFHHQLDALPARPLESWGKFRWQDEVLIVEWLYDQTADPKLLQLCTLLKQQGFDWTASFADFTLTEPVTRSVLGMTDKGIEHEELAMRAHGVNNGQALKTAAVQYRLSGDKAEQQNYRRQLGALDRYHGQPSGMFSCDEHLGGLDPSHGTELCTVVETLFSMQTALSAFGDPVIADRIERIAYNALPGTFTDDMWAHQYNQQANQVLVGLNSKPWTTDGPESNLYGLEPHFGCCTANYHQGWPKLTGSLWMATADDGLVAALYAPCEVRTTVRKTPVHLVEETEYPFRPGVRITVSPETPLRFPVLFHVPAWAQGASIRINGEPAPAQVRTGAFVRIDRLWSPGDRVELTLPMRPRVTRWFQDSIAVEHGPLIFSLDPGESWVKLRDRGLTADWQVFPTGSWNYALAVDEASAPALRVIERPVPARPFSAAASALAIEVNGRRLTGWRPEDGVAAPPPQSPVKSGEPDEALTLIPYAAAKLRITAFPQLGPALPKSAV